MRPQGGAVTIPDKANAGDEDEEAGLHPGNDDDPAPPLRLRQAFVVGLRRVLAEDQTGSRPPGAGCPGEDEVQEAAAAAQVACNALRHTHISASYPYHAERLIVVRRDRHQRG